MREIRRFTSTWSSTAFTSMRSSTAGTSRPAAAPASDETTSIGFAAAASTRSSGFAAAVSTRSIRIVGRRTGGVVSGPTSPPPPRRSARPRSGPVARARRRRPRNPPPSRSRSDPRHAPRPFSSPRLSARGPPVVWQPARRSVLRVDIGAGFAIVDRCPQLDMTSTRGMDDGPRGRRVPADRRLFG